MDADGENDNDQDCHDGGVSDDSSESLGGRRSKMKRIMPRSIGDGLVEIANAARAAFADNSQDKINAFQANVDKRILDIEKKADARVDGVETKVDTMLELLRKLTEK